MLVLFLLCSSRAGIVNSGMMHEGESEPMSHGPLGYRCFSSGLFAGGVVPRPLWVWLWLFWGLVGGPFSAAWAVEMPYTMMVTGTVGAGTVVPRKGDFILVLGPDLKLEGSGSVGSNDGLYVITMSKSSSFNGQTLTMQFRQGTKIYELLLNGTPASFQFSGSILPNQLPLDPVVGKFLRNTTTAADQPTGTQYDEPTTPPPVAVPTTTDGAASPAGQKYDLNGDGKVNQADVQVMYAVLEGSMANARADVNGDGVVNTRDLIDLIRNVSTLARAKAPLPIVRASHLPAAATTTGK